jgi:hypothetical protein
MITNHPTALRLHRRRCSFLAALCIAASAVQAEAADGADADAAPRVGAEQAAEPQTARMARAKPGRAEIGRLIELAARRHGVEPALVHAVVAAESDYVIHAVSPAGAVGLMQLMPVTASDYGVASRAALFDPSTNIDTGVRHLKRLLRKYRGDYGRAIMAYNAGEGVVDRTRGQVRFAETLNYTETVVRRYQQLGGSKDTAPILRKVAAFQGRPAPAPASRSPGREPEVLGLLPATNPKLEARLPKAPLDGRSPLQTAGHAAANAPPTLGGATRTGRDPAIRAAAPAAPTGGFGAPRLR